MVAAASCSSSFQFSGPPPLNVRQAHRYGVACRTSIAPPEAFNDLFHQVTDRLTAVARLGRRAMIALIVRNSRLIAPSAHTSPSFPQETAVIHGFCEDEPLCFERTTGAWRGSAARVPQVCGHRSALFAPEGMIDWLRRHFPRSTCHHVEAATGIPAATIDNWLIRRSQPSVEHFTKLIAAFGPDLLRASLWRPPGWIDRAAAGERARQIDEEIARLTRERAGLEGGGR